MIKTFRSANAERLFRRERVKLFEGFEKQVLRKLVILHAAQKIDDLASVPGDRLEKLKGSREHQHSIRINDQWRVCFVWKEGNAFDVEIVDYND